MEACSQTPLKKTKLFQARYKRSVTGILFVVPFTCMCALTNCIDSVLLLLGYFVPWGIYVISWYPFDAFSVSLQIVRPLNSKPFFPFTRVSDCTASSQPAGILWHIFQSTFVVTHFHLHISSIYCIWHTQGYHTVLICKICPEYEGDCLRKLHCTSKKCTYFGIASFILFYFQQ